MKKSVKKSEKRKEELAALFIPAGIFFGLGFGFLYSRIVEGLFIGLGFGFFFYAVAALFSRKNAR